MMSDENGTEGRRPRTMRQQVIAWLGFLGPVLGLACVVTLFALLDWHRAGSWQEISFLTLYNFKTVITQTVIVGIGALGMTLVIVSGGIDLSVGSLVALCTVITASILAAWDVESVGWGVAALGALAGIAACGGCGMITGIISTRLRITPFIVTLGMMQIARGLAKWLGREQTVITPDNPLQELMNVEPESEWLTTGLGWVLGRVGLHPDLTCLRFAPGVWLMLFLTVVVWVVLRYTVFGRYTFAVGSSEACARLCGIRVSLHRTLIYLFCGVFTGIAGVMQYANLTVGDPTAAGGMELDIIAAVVIGGGSLNGGQGSAVGSLMGALIMAVLRNGCTMLGVPNYVQNIIIGSIIIGAVGIDGLRGK